MERSAGRSITWHRTISPTVPGIPPGTQAYVSPESMCTVLVSHTEGAGWHISVAHPWRAPSWNEIASARYQLVPDGAYMAMYLPPAAEYVNLHEHCFHLMECRCHSEARPNQDTAPATER